MVRALPWTRRINTRLAGITSLLLLVTLALIAFNLSSASALRSDAHAAHMSARGRGDAYRVLYLITRLVTEANEARPALHAELAHAMQAAEERLSKLRDGSAGDGLARAADPRVADSLRQREDFWRMRVVPLLERAHSAPSAEEREAALVSLRQQTSEWLTLIERSVSAQEQLADETLNRFEAFQFGFLALVLLIIGGVMWVARSVGRRTEALSATAERIAGGELELTAPVRGNDEIARLGESFNAMTASLREVIGAEQKGRASLEQALRAVAEAANALASGTAEILAGTAQQASGTQEQAASVQQTVTTVDEVVQTANQAAQRAHAVAESSQRSVEISRAGRQAVEETTAAMGALKDHVEGIAESILGLAEQAQAIGEIIASVNEVAEQTNLLALNAGIEASRAGEQGRGFAVVAAEIKQLADQAKRATAQVRQILGEIQKSTNRAVLATEEGQRSALQAMKQVAHAGETIRLLSETIAEAAQAANQIAASTGQQAAGMAQIHQAMRNISQATSQNLASTRQQEKAAQDLNALGLKLKDLLAGYGH